jgi:hypothetical protein
VGAWARGGIRSRLQGPRVERHPPRFPLLAAAGLVVALSHAAGPQGTVPTRYPAEDEPASRTARHRARAEPQRVRERLPSDRTGDPFPCAGKWSSEPLRERVNCAVARFPEPSAGLEPATPSLPWQSGASSRRPTQSQNACTRVTTRGLQPPAGVGTILHSQVPRRYLRSERSRATRLAALEQLHGGCRAVRYIDHSEVALIARGIERSLALRPAPGRLGGLPRHPRPPIRWQLAQRADTAASSRDRGFGGGRPLRNPEEREGGAAPVRFESASRCAGTRG